MISFLAFLAIGASFRYIAAIQNIVKNKILWVMLFSAMFLFIPVFVYFFSYNDGLVCPSVVE